MLPSTAYRDWLKTLLENKRDLQKMSLLTDSAFLGEIFRYLKREGWQEELFNLASNTQDLHRLILRFPDQWQDVVDAHSAFGAFIKDWQVRVA